MRSPKSTGCPGSQSRTTRTVVVGTTLRLFLSTNVASPHLVSLLQLSRKLVRFVCELLNQLCGSQRPGRLRCMDQARKTKAKDSMNKVRMHQPKGDIGD